MKTMNTQTLYVVVEDAEDGDFFYGLYLSNDEANQAKQAILAKYAGKSYQPCLEIKTWPIGKRYGYVYDVDSSG